MSKDFNELGAGMYECLGDTKASFETSRDLGLVINKVSMWTFIVFLLLMYFIKQLYNCLYIFRIECVLTLDVCVCFFLNIFTVL